MEKAGIVYLMKTVIKGVYKIGITDENNFEIECAIWKTTATQTLPG